jgi:adenine-specific DNA-methyltransferase
MTGHECTRLPYQHSLAECLDAGVRIGRDVTALLAAAVRVAARDEFTDSCRDYAGLVIMTNEGYDYLVARNAADEGFYLVWDGSPEPVFDEAAYDAVVSEAVKAKLKPVYHVYARFNLFQSDDVLFYQTRERPA